MPTRPKAHQIGEKAEGIFKRLLPESWISWAQDPDYGIDFVVETVEGQDPTGLEFAVQLKGRTKPRKTGSSFCVPIETELLSYYVDNQRQPVFLILIDVRNETGYWIFLQKYILYDLGSDNWRQKKSLTIRIPKKNLLSDTDSSHKAIRDAEEFMVGLRPAAINNAIETDIARRESLDPRFAIDLTVEKGAKHYQLNPREPVTCSFQFKGHKQQINEIIHSLVGRGIPVDISANQINVSGSPLLSDFMKKGGTMHWRRVQPGTITFTAIDGEQQAMDKTVVIPGTFEGGTSEFRFTGSLPDSPLTIASTFNPGQDGKVTSDGIQYNIDCTKWYNHQVLYLPHFDDIFFLLKSLISPARLKATFNMKGNIIFSTLLTSIPQDNSDSTIGLLEIFSKARKIAKVIQANPIIPQLLSTDHFDSIEHLYRILIDPEQTNTNGLVLTITMESQDLERVLNIDKARFEDGEVSISNSSVEYDFFGSKVLVSGFNLFMTHAKLLTNLAELRCKHKRQNAEPIEVKWVGTPKTRIVYEAKDVEVI